ncbi:MAG: hypothetical protein AMJ90_07770 [candidate division Zixibacteria bacterium SM23_73_2]|nr:MAG: hypothetical protein AMJ90_07770 [candidate division Zixibacteria bacterium SM23_73_2]
MFYGNPWISLVSIGKMLFSLILLALLVVIPITIYNLGSKLDRISQKLDRIGELLKAEQKA